MTALKIPQNCRHSIIFTLKAKVISIKITQENDKLILQCEL